MFDFIADPDLDPDVEFFNDFFSHCGTGATVRKPTMYRDCESCLGRCLRSNECYSGLTVGCSVPMNAL